ncbi:MAG TPA: cysteine desulfurase family protein [Jiangellaceae bacterium]|nr:cysteine desulfurase family protein [Jiangellaceae bacterium]
MSPTSGEEPDAPVSGYFDAASTEPMHPAARDIMSAALDEGWGDPARLYGVGRRARLLLDNAREVVAAVIGCRADEVSFTSSGTQAVHLAVLGAAGARARAGRDLVVSAIEHSAVLQSAAYHDRRGGHTHQVGVDRTGLVDPAGFAAAITDTTAVACLQSANHEVGTVQPVEEVAELCSRYGVPLVVDAAQSVGRVSVPAGWSILTASAHKWGGPAGVGVLAVRRSARWKSPLPDDERGGGRAAGFENVPAALAAAAALRARAEESAELAGRHVAMVDRLRTRIPELVPDVEVVGHPTLRLPHLMTFSCLYVDGEALVTELDRAGFAVSSGSSCTASTLRPSHVLEAMGVLTHGNIRISLPREATDADIGRFLDVLPGLVSRIRAEVGL